MGSHLTKVIDPSILQSVYVQINQSTTIQQTDKMTSITNWKNFSILSNLFHEPALPINRSITQVYSMWQSYK